MNKLELKFAIEYSIIDASKFSPGFNSKPDDFQLIKRDNLNFTLYLNFNEDPASHPFDDIASRYNNVIAPSKVIISLDKPVDMYRLTSCTTNNPYDNCEYNLPPPIFSESKTVFTIPSSFFQGRNGGWVNYSLPPLALKPTPLSKDTLAIFLISLFRDITYVLIPFIVTLLGIDIANLFVNNRDKAKIPKVLAYMLVFFEVILSILIIILMWLLGFSGLVTYIFKTGDEAASLIVSFILYILPIIIPLIAQLTRRKKISQSIINPPNSSQDQTTT